MQFPGIFAVFIGALMLIQWTILLVTGQVPELKTEPYRIVFHIVGEMLTAAVLIAGGAGVLLPVDWGTAVFFIGMGMLFYTLIVSPGYYAQKGEWRMVLMFAIILVISIFSAVVMIL